jgi:guanylate kinase
MNDVIITLTGPSGSGKTYLLEHLIKGLNFYSVVSLTSRSPREGEVEGRDYFFTDKKKFEEMMINGELIEFINYDDNFYGITKEEFYKKKKMGPICLILDPAGLKQYKHIAEDLNIKLLSFFIHTSESVRIKRVIDRFAKDIIVGSKIPEFTLAKPIIKLESRLNKIFTEEREWLSTCEWDYIIDGELSPSLNEKIISEIIQRNVR